MYKNLVPWSEKGYVHIDQPNAVNYTIWTAKLTFRHNKLADISIDVE